MNVIIVTPIYYIEGRDNLFHDSNAVHYLLKEWPKDTNIYVFHEYHSGPKQWIRYVKKKEREYLRNGYFFEKNNIKINMIELPILPKQKKLFSFQKNKMISCINNYLRNNKIIPDIAIFHQPSYYSCQYFSLLNLNCPKYAVLHYSDIKRIKNDFHFKSQLGKFDKLFSRSNYIRDYFKSTGLKNISEDIIYSGVPANSAKEQKKFHDKFRLLYVGKLIERKKIDLILYALNKINLDKIEKFTIIGKGKEKKKLENIVRRMRLENKVEFVEAVPREKVFEYMEKNDIFIMPSINETLGLVYLEAMSVGCITIGTKNEGIDGIITDGVNGFLVKPNSIESIVQKINCILDNKKDINEISKNALETASRFSEHQIGNDYYNVIIKELEIE